VRLSARLDCRSKNSSIFYDRSSAVKPLRNLSLADLEVTAVWRYLGKDDDTGFVEATTRTSLSEAKKVTFIAAARFTLADGTVFMGFVTPLDTSGLDYVQPVIVTPTGHVRFWFERRPTDEILGGQRACLNRGPEKIFPVRWLSLVPVHGRSVSGVIEAVESLRGD
jgi:hypothetical protein